MADGMQLLTKTEWRLVAATDLSVPGHAFPLKYERERVLPTRHFKSTREPKCSFTIYAKLSSYWLRLELQNVLVEGEQRLWIELVVTKSERPSGSAPSSWKRPEVCSHKFKPLTSGEDVDLDTISSLSCNHWVQATVKVYTPVAGPPGRMLLNGLQRARLKGGAPECDALLCAGGSELPVHRLVLAACSSVFAAAFAGGFKEAADGRVDVKDASPAALAKFVDYLYTEELADWDGFELLELLRLADKYLVQPLREDCELAMWLADGPCALSLLLAAAQAGTAAPLVTAEHRKRWMRVAAHNLPVLLASPQWAALQEAHPFVAEAIETLGSADGSTSQWPGSTTAP